MPGTLGNITNRSYSNDFFNYTGIHFGNDNDIKKQSSQIDLQNLSGNCKNYASTSVTFPCLFWGTAEMGDLVRSALISIPKHQYESGYGLGLTKLQVFIYIIFPQTIRRLLPSAINLLTRMIKTTSLVVLIGVVEVVKVGKQIIDASRYTASDSALWVYGAIFLMYFVICFPFSRLSAFLGKKLAG